MGQEKSLNHNDKFILKRKDFLWDVAWLTWSLPCESILISSLKGKNETKTICVDISKEQNLSLQAQGGKFYITSSKLMNFSDLNKNYFRPEELVEPLKKKISKEEAEKIIKETEKKRKKISFNYILLALAALVGGYIYYVNKIKMVPGIM